MPRPVINGQVGAGALPATSQRTGATRRLHTGRRSAAYLRAIAKIDSSVHLEQTETRELVDAIRREFAEKWTDEPIGFVARCYLGVPYEVHTLTTDGAILAHYKTGQSLPGLLERARSLAASDAYDVIEVYPDRLICVHKDGAVTVSEGGR
jgi:hypothetical protein